MGRPNSVTSPSIVKDSMLAIAISAPSTKQSPTPSAMDSATQPSHIATPRSRPQREDLKLLSPSPTGAVAGKEAVQLYVSAPAGGLTKPVRELKSFAKTRQLQPGESQTLTMRVTTYDLASYNEATQAWETPSGKYQIHFAAHVDDIRCSTVYSQSKTQSVKGHDVMRPSMTL